MSLSFPDTENFELDMRGARAIVPGMIEEFTKEVAEQALDLVVPYTPRDVRGVPYAGDAAGNWQVGIDKTNEDETGIQDPAGIQTVLRGSAVIRAAHGFGVINIFNNAVHILLLEYEPGYSRDPGEMLHKTVNDILARYGP
jgi:hypothetical protein